MNNRVGAYRERQGLTQGELAAAVGVTRQTINNVERGRYDPSLELAFALAAFFDCRVEDLFDPNLDVDLGAGADAGDGPSATGPDE
jgi:putative transcriptional regulator